MDSLMLQMYDIVSSACFRRPFEVSVKRCWVLADPGYKLSKDCKG